MTDVELHWDGPHAKILAHEGGVLGLKLGTEHLLEAANRTVPLEEGTLERSGATDVDEDNLTGSVYYDSVYAAYQHEGLDFRHAPGRRAKWLELAVDEESATIEALIATQLRRALE